MRTLKDVKAGDEIVMIWRSGRPIGDSARAVVTVARPVNLEIRSVDQHPERVWKVRRDMRKAEQHGWYAYTVEEHEAIERRRAALAFLHEQGISIASYQPSPWRGREIELAEVIKAGMQDRGYL